MGSHERGSPANGRLGRKFSTRDGGRGGRWRRDRWGELRGSEGFAGVDCLYQRGSNLGSGEVGEQRGGGRSGARGKCGYSGGSWAGGFGGNLGGGVEEMNNSR